MYCTKCGNALAETAAFCGGCGQPVAGPLPHSAAPPPESPGLMNSGVPVAQPVSGWPPAPGMSVVAYTLPSPFAGFWLRLVAHIIDGLLIGVVFCMVVLFAIAVVGVGSFKDNFQNIENPDDFFTAAIIGAVVIIILLVTIGAWLYYALMESSPHQGTLGKIALGLFVTDLQGRRITFGRASGRFFARIITGLIPFYIGFIMAGFTEKKQALHDMIASCLVLRKN